VLDQDEKFGQQDTALKQAVRHPTRLAVLGFVAGRKTGVNEDELSSALDVPRVRVKYHLKVLQSAGLVANVADAPSGVADCYVASTASS
jgi:DNA-binding transcriptional ArsR family regulator